MSKPTQLTFDQRYSDNSAVEFAVHYKTYPVAEIDFEHFNSVSFPIEELDWLIACLQHIKSETQP